MIPYLLILLFSTLVAHVGRLSNKHLIQSYSLIVVGVVLIGFAGFRDYSIGTDTGGYIWGFIHIDMTSATEGGFELGFNILMWIARSCSDSYYALLILIALLVVSPYLYTIRKLVSNYEFGIFLFIVLGVYTFFFNGARQGIAAAICFAAIPFLLNRKCWLYFSLVLFASAFHQTAIVALPLYFLASPAVNWKKLAFIGFITTLTVVLLQTSANIAAQFLDEKFASYTEAGEGGGMVFVTFLTAQGILLYVFKGSAGNSHITYSRLLNVYLIGLIPSIASVLSGVNPSGLLRLNLYFSSTAILLWPLVFSGLKGGKRQSLLTLGFVVFMLAYFTMTTNAFSNLAPYKLNTEIFQ